MSSVRTHIKCIKDEKVYLPFKSQAIVILWGFAATLKRIMAIVAVFIPCLGLFDLLSHWQAEQIPFAVRRQKAQDGTMKDNDRLELCNLNEVVYWNEVDRTDWTEPHTPVFPGYTSYTGLSLRETFLSFLALLGVQFLTVLILKFIFVKSIRETKGKKLDILRHCLENMNIPVPWEDFDVQRGKIEEYKERRRRVHKEMFWVMISNLIFHLLMLLPLIYTGENELRIFLSSQTLSEGVNISRRHHLLTRTIGTRQEEDHSYQRLLLLLSLFVVSVLVFSLLEMAFYFLYSVKVRQFTHRNESC